MTSNTLRKCILCMTCMTTWLFVRHIHWVGSSRDTKPLNYVVSVLTHAIAVHSTSTHQLLSRDSLRELEGGHSALLPSLWNYSPLETQCGKIRWHNVKTSGMKKLFRILILQIMKKVSLSQDHFLGKKEKKQSFSGHIEWCHVMV